MTVQPKLRFKGFTDDWEKRQLGDLAIIQGGGTPSSTNSDYWNGNINWFTPTEVSNTGYVKESARKITKLGLKKSSAKLLPKGTVLMTSRAGVGNMGILKVPAATNQGFQSMIPNEDIPSYFLYSMQSFISREANRLASGSTFSEISGKQVSKISINVPSEQGEKIQIGKLFERLNILITVNQRKVDLLEKKKSAYLQKLFPKTGSNIPELRFKGFTDAWEKRRLIDNTKLITKGTTPKDKSGVGNVNFIKVENLSNNQIYPVQKISQEEHDSYLKRSRLQANDILFSIAGTLGRIAIVGSSLLPANTNQALSIIRGYDFDSDFLITSLSGHVVAEYIRKNPTVGAQPNLSLEQVGNLIISSPIEEEQEKIGSFFKLLNHLITVNQRKVDLLKEKKKSLLQQMFI